MDFIRKNSSFQTIELKLVLMNSSHQDDLFELLLSQIVPKLRLLDLFKNMFIFCISTKKLTFMVAVVRDEFFYSKPQFCMRKNEKKLMAINFLLYLLPFVGNMLLKFLLFSYISL